MGEECPDCCSQIHVAAAEEHNAAEAAATDATTADAADASAAADFGKDFAGAQEQLAKLQVAQEHKFAAGLPKGHEIAGQEHAVTVAYVPRHPRDCEITTVATVVIARQPTDHETADRNLSGYSVANDCSCGHEITSSLAVCAGTHRGRPWIFPQKQSYVMCFQTLNVSFRQVTYPSSQILPKDHFDFGRELHSEQPVILSSLGRIVGSQMWVAEAFLVIHASVRKIVSSSLARVHFDDLNSREIPT